MTFLLATMPAGGAAQSLTSGSLSGVVQDRDGAPVSEADVHATGIDLGMKRSSVTGRSGTFSLGLLPPGRYDVLVERRGYRPFWVRGVIVRAGQASKVEADLTPATPPVDRADESSWLAPAVGWSAGLAQAIPEGELRTRLGRRSLGSLTELTAFSGAENEVAGLPAFLAGGAADGIAVRSLAHPQLGVDPLAAGAFTLGSLGGATVLAALPDVEWPGFAGGLLSVRSRAGTGSSAADAFGAWAGSALSSSKNFDASAVSHTSILGGGVVGGPITRDSMHALVGLEVQRLELPYAGLPAVESPGSWLGSQGQPGVAARQLWSGFGRFDWRLAPAHTLVARASASGIPDNRLTLPFESEAVPGAAVKGRDVSAGFTLLSEWSRVTASEFRFGVQLSQRDYGVADSASSGSSTVFTSDGSRLGINSDGPGAFDRGGFRVAQIVHLIGAAHRFKIGLSGELSKFKQTYAYGRGGEFFLTSRQAGEAFGSFVQTVGPVPEVEVNDRAGGLFAQDIWTPLPGLELTVGGRVDLAQSKFDFTPNTEWLRATALELHEPNSKVQFSPRGAIRWDLQDQHRVVVTAAAGIDNGPSMESPFAEVSAHQGLVDVRRAIGAFSGWPAAPNLPAGAVEGPRLAFLGPDYRPPRTMRAAAGVEVVPATGTLIQLGFLLRQTEFLPRRHDLNRLAAPVGTDQNGRAIWGELSQAFGVLAAVPGSNRRFPDFAEVFALEADGTSDYQGVFVGLRHESGPIGVAAGFTRSTTSDNWLGQRSASPYTRLNPQLAATEGTDWTDGTSDYDVPNRAYASARLRVSGRIPVTLAAVFTYRSGYPFTPSVQPGVDANGDGSAWNDPAFIDDALDGADALLGSWACLRNQLRQFAERNSCRGDPVQALDARISIDLLRIGGHSGQLLVDVLNVIEPTGAFPDPAFVRIDATGTLERTPASGTVRIPYVINPNFGKPVGNHTFGRMVYVGFRVYR
jgi:hypothetical protein